MLPISTDYNSSKVEVLSQENVVLSAGYISEIKENYIQIVCGTTMPILERRTFIKVHVYNSALGFRVLLGRVDASGSGFVRITEVFSVQEEERRRYFRVSTHLPILLHHPNPRYGQGEENEIETIEASTVDLSFGGALIESDVDLMGKYIMAIPLYDNVYSFIIQILRKKIAEDGTKLFACEFKSSAGIGNDKLCECLWTLRRKQAEEGIGPGKVDHHTHISQE